MRYVVDRIEENFAVCLAEETDDVVNFDLSTIPFFINEGDVIIYENDEWNKEEKDNEMTERIKNKMDDLWN